MAQIKPEEKKSKGKPRRRGGETIMEDVRDRQKIKLKEKAGPHHSSAHRPASTYRDPKYTKQSYNK